MAGVNIYDSAVWWGLSLWFNNHALHTCTILVNKSFHLVMMKLFWRHYQSLSLHPNIQHERTNKSLCTRSSQRAYHTTRIIYRIHWLNCDHSWLPPISVLESGTKKHNSLIINPSISIPPIWFCKYMYIIKVPYQMILVSCLISWWVAIYSRRSIVTVHLSSTLTIWMKEHKVA